MKKNENKNITSTLKCLKGWYLNIESLRQLWDWLRGKYDFYFLLTRRLQQDLLEHFFSVIRQKGGYSSNPTPKLFGCAYNAALINTLLTPPESSNCELGIPEWGQIFENAKALKLESQEPHNLADEEEEEEEEPAAIDDPNTAAEIDPEGSSKMYVFGFIARKILLKHPNCEKCRNLIVTNPQTNCQSILPLDYKKMYTFLKSYKEDGFGNLFVCTDEFYNFLDACDKATSKYLAENIHKPKVIQNLTNIFANICYDTSKMTELCPQLKENLFAYFGRVRLYYILKFENEILGRVQPKGKRNRKFCHFAHI